MKEGRNNNLYKTSGVSAVWLLSVQMFLLYLTTGKALCAKDRLKSVLGSFSSSRWESDWKRLN